jgi:hypothetical protein
MKTRLCANCSRPLGMVMDSCRRCGRTFCSPAVRDCILVHGCKGDTIGDRLVRSVRVEE